MPLPDRSATELTRACAPEHVEGNAHAWSPEWVSQRACVDVPPEVFFPEVGRDASRAKAICATCPVKAECLAFALTNREEFGVWGGLTPRQRRPHQADVTRPHVARCGTDAGYYRHLRQTHTEPCDECRAAHAIAHRVRKFARAEVAS